MQLTINPFMLVRPGTHVHVSTISTEPDIYSLSLSPHTIYMYCVHAFFQEFFSFLLPLLQGSVQLLEVYSDTAEVVGVVLELFALTADNYIVFLKEVRNRQRGVLISEGCCGCV